MGNPQNTKLVKRMNQIKVLNDKEMKNALSQEELEIKLAEERILQAEENLKDKLVVKDSLNRNLIESKRKVLEEFDHLKGQEVALNEAIVDAERKSLDEINAELKLTEIQEKRLSIEFNKSIDIAENERQKAMERREKSKEYEEELLDIQLRKHQSELDAIIKNTEEEIDDPEIEALAEQQKALQEAEVQMLEEEALAAEVEDKMIENDSLSGGTVEDKNIVLNMNTGRELSRKERKALKKGLKDAN